MDKIERIPGYSNKMMLDQLNAVFKVMSKTKMVTSGRGRNVVTKEVPMYRNMDEPIAEVKNSIEHYKNMKVEFRDYQKEIIQKESQKLLHFPEILASLFVSWKVKLE
jgi:hypothetical protein